MTDDWEDLDPGSKADVLKERLDDIEARLETQSQMFVGVDKLREDVERLSNIVDRVGFVDLGTHDPDAEEGGG